MCSVDHEAVLRRLHSYGRQPAILRRLAEREGRLLGPAIEPALTDARFSDTEYHLCSNTVKLIYRCQPAILHAFNPIHVTGDGNCLFRSVSLAVYGSEDHHVELRVRAALEIGQFQE